MEKQIEFNGDNLENNTIYKLIKFYESNGIILWTENGKLKYRAPKEKVDKKLLGSLKKQKEPIIKYLEYKKGSSISESFRLTPIQYAYLIGRSSDYELGNINAHYYTEYSCNNINVDKLQKIINQVINKHDALRTIVYESGYQKVMEKVPELVIPIHYKDNKIKLKDIRKEWSHHIYPLGTWPMFYFQVSKNKDNLDILHFSFDCIILDAWSARLMLIEIFKLYNDKVISWPSFTFKEYLEKEKSYLKGDKSYIKAEKYWTKKLNNIPDYPKLPFKKQLFLIEKPYFSRIYHKFTLYETKILYDKMRKYHFTPSAVICTVFMKVLSFFSKNKDLTLNLTLFNRIPINKEVPNILGEFTNVGLASYYEKNLNFYDEVNDIQKQFWKLVQYRTYDGTNLLKKLSVNKLGKAVMPIVYTSMLQGQLENEMTCDFKEIYAISQTPQVVLDHQARDDNNGLALSWDYVLEAFDFEIIQHMFLVYIKTIKKLIFEESWNKPILINN